MNTSTQVTEMSITLPDNIPFQGYSHMDDQRTQSVNYIVLYSLKNRKLEVLEKTAEEISSETGNKVSPR